MEARKIKSDLLVARDRKMVEEFYNLHEVKRLRMDDVLLKLSEEIFFLSTTYIYKRIFSISENRSYLDVLIRSKMAAKQN
jgi:hypothetical protein